MSEKDPFLDIGRSGVTGELARSAWLAEDLTHVNNTRELRTWLWSARHGLWLCLLCGGAFLSRPVGHQFWQRTARCRDGGNLDLLLDAPAGVALTGRAAPNFWRIVA